MCFQEKKAFESDLFLLGRDKCKTMEKGKKLQASREPPSRSFSNRGHNREKGKDQKCSRIRSLSDRIRSRVCSAGYKDLSAFLFTKRCVCHFHVITYCCLVGLLIFLEFHKYNLLNVWRVNCRWERKWSNICYYIYRLYPLDMLRSHLL